MTNRAVQICITVVEEDGSSQTDGAGREGNETPQTQFEATIYPTFSLWGHETREAARFV